MDRRVTAISIVLIAASAHAQCERWISGGLEQVSAYNGDGRSVFALTTWDPDGSGPKPEMLVVGGAFSVSGVPGASSIAAWDGLAWHGFANGIGSTVRALTVFNGELIAGGDFATSAGSMTLGRWDGSAWRPVGGGVSGGYGLTQVLALTVFDEKLVVGGNFDTAGGLPTSNNIAQWDGASWSALGAGVAGLFGDAGVVRALAVHKDRLFVGGDFTWVDGRAGPAFVASWNGTAWESTGLGGNFPGASALLSDGDDLYAGGYDFTINGNINCAGLTRWDGLNWHQVGNPSGNPPGVCTLAKYGTNLVAGGWIGYAAGLQMNFLAAWDGARWTPLGGGTSDIARAMTTFHGELIVGGDFLWAGGMPAPHLARRTLTGVPWIAAQTPARSAPRGGRAVLKALVAPGYPVASYRWTRGGVVLDDDSNISGATSPVLLLRPVADSDAGSYSCIITTDCATIASKPAPVVVRCAGDLNGDGVVDDSDFTGFVLSYNLLDCENDRMATDCLADLSGDGVVDDADFSPFVVAYDALLCP